MRAPRVSLRCLHWSGKRHLPICRRIDQLVFSNRAGTHVNVSLISRIWLIITSRSAEPLMSAGSPTACRTLLRLSASSPPSLRLLSRSFQATAVHPRHHHPRAPFTHLSLRPSAFRSVLPPSFPPSSFPCFYPLLGISSFLSSSSSSSSSPPLPSSLTWLPPQHWVGGWRGYSRRALSRCWISSSTTAVFTVVFWSRLSQFSGFINRFSRKLRRLLEDLLFFL